MLDRVRGAMKQRQWSMRGSPWFPQIVVVCSSRAREVITQRNLICLCCLDEVDDAENNRRRCEACGVEPYEVLMKPSLFTYGEARNVCSGGWHEGIGCGAADLSRHSKWRACG